MFQDNLHNVFDGTIIYMSMIFNTLITSQVPSGTYSTIKEVLAALTTAVGVDSASYQFTANEKTHKVTVELLSAGGIRPYLEFSTAVYCCILLRYFTFQHKI